MSVVNCRFIGVGPVRFRDKAAGQSAWFESHSFDQIDSPPTDHEYIGREDGDVYIHRVSFTNQYQVWVWLNDRWQAVQAGFQRQLPSGETRCLSINKTGIAWVKASTWGKNRKGW
jgi:hypothetical protein